MDNIIHLSAHLACDVEHAFALFTTNAALERWLAPTANIEPVLGGAYELFWQPDNRAHNSTLGCVITAIVPNQLLAFEWRSPEQFESFANSADPLTHVVVSFIPAGIATHVHLVHSGWRHAPEWDSARRWQERAWTIAFEELARHTAALRDEQ